jgi:hypothetical protein
MFCCHLHTNVRIVRDVSLPDPYQDHRSLALQTDVVCLSVWRFLKYPPPPPEATQLYMLSRDGVTITGFWLVRYSVYAIFMTAHYISLLRKSARSSVLSQGFTSRCLVAAISVGRSSSYGFPFCPRPQLPAYYSYGPLDLSSRGYLTDSLTNCQAGGPVSPCNLHWTITRRLSAELLLVK